MKEEGLTEIGASRRSFIGKVSATTFVLLTANILTEEQVKRIEEIIDESIIQTSASDQNPVTVNVKINGKAIKLTVDSRTTLLDALRERLGLTGTKKGCDHGQCGACTVLVDNRRILSCLTLMAMCDGHEIITIEGLAKGNNLHPMQEAFIKHDAFQCGYCTPGQICSAVALLEEAKNGEVSYITPNLQTIARNLKLSDDEIRERMSGNLCRCGAYPNIVKAIQEVQNNKII
ncbi:MAG: 2Fe-2S iron-sulfur cluster-binding protein [Pyrinomonadaceae bacterium]|nr:2Fe-2S iron-sulfur cluster-binding protein [Pyrinomonadaceae bacterium]MCX7639445.1 2Fe-2S iron-sulfur cluster-binding protein [Pyrinomonadaceae bacterium]MDW8304505.1 2Fe-2S iron-sulfur cluster-binding protein [Acidobacteriota bacterium]